MTYVTYLFGFPTGSFPVRTRRLAGCSSTGSTSRPCWCSPASRSRCGGGCATEGALAVQSFAIDFFPLILLFAISVTGLALTASHALAARRVLPLPRHPARDHRDRGAALPAVRQVLPHLPAPGAARREALPGGRRRATRAPRCARCGERFASRMHIDDLKRGAAAARLRLRDARARRHWQDLCPACKRKTLAHRRRLRMQGGGPWLSPRSPLRRARPRATARTSNYTPARRAGRTSRAHAAGPAGEDALLLLRPAVRHPAQGARQPGGRLRAVGGVPVQPRHALPEGREALPAERAPRPPARRR